MRTVAGAISMVFTLHLVCFVQPALAQQPDTSAQQADNLFRVAAEMGRADALRDALRGRTVVVSIGPITTEALQGHGIRPDLHPEHPKMGHLLIAVAREADNLLRRKRGG